MGGIAVETSGDTARAEGLSGSEPIRITASLPGGESGREIELALIPNSADSRLSASRVVTDADGIAAVSLFPGLVEEVVQVQATTFDRATGRTLGVVSDPVRIDAETAERVTLRPGCRVQPMTQDTQWTVDAVVSGSQGRAVPSTTPVLTQVSSGTVEACQLSNSRCEIRVEPDGTEASTVLRVATEGRTACEEDPCPFASDAVAAETQLHQAMAPYTVGAIAGEAGVRALSGSDTFEIDRGDQGFLVLSLVSANGVAVPEGTEVDVVPLREAEGVSFTDPAALGCPLSSTEGPRSVRVAVFAEPIEEEEAPPQTGDGEGPDVGPFPTAPEPESFELPLRIEVTNAATDEVEFRQIRLIVNP